MVEAWWKPAPDHGDQWTWGSVSGVAVDNPNRIIVAIWGDQGTQGQGERPRSTNYLVVVNRNGDIVENWLQWDTLFNRPHQVYISPYDPERHVWVVERGGNGVHEQILKFTNDGKRLVMRLRDPQPVMSEEEQRKNTNPGPLDFGQPAVLAFLPDGHFLLGDGYQNGRVVKYTNDGQFVMQFGSVGTGPGQFDLVHGIAVDRNSRIYVSDRMNHRVQVFTPDGKYIEGPEPDAQVQRERRASGLLRCIRKGLVARKARVHVLHGAGCVWWHGASAPDGQRRAGQSLRRRVERPVDG